MDRKLFESIKAASKAVDGRALYEAATGRSAESVTIARDWLQALKDIVANKADALKVIAEFDKRIDSATAKGDLSDIYAQIRQQMPDTTDLGMVAANIQSIEQWLTQGQSRKNEGSADEILPLVAGAARGVAGAARGAVGAVNGAIKTGKAVVGGVAKAARTVGDVANKVSSVAGKVGAAAGKVGQYAPQQQPQQQPQPAMQEGNTDEIIGAVVGGAANLAGKVVGGAVKQVKKAASGVAQGAGHVAGALHDQAQPTQNEVMGDGASFVSAGKRPSKVNSSGDASSILKTGVNYTDGDALDALNSNSNGAVGDEIVEGYYVDEDDQIFFVYEDGDAYYVDEDYEPIEEDDTYLGNVFEDEIIGEALEAVEEDDSDSVYAWELFEAEDGTVVYYDDDGRLWEATDEEIEDALNEDINIYYNNDGGSGGGGMPPDGDDPDGGMPPDDGSGGMPPETGGDPNADPNAAGGDGGAAGGAPQEPMQVELINNGQGGEVSGVVVDVAGKHIEIGPDGTVNEQPAGAGGPPAAPAAGGGQPPQPTVQETLARGANILATFFDEDNDDCSDVARKTPRTAAGGTILKGIAYIDPKALDALNHGGDIDGNKAIQEYYASFDSYELFEDVDGDIVYFDENGTLWRASDSQIAEAKAKWAYGETEAEGESEVDEASRLSRRVGTAKLGQVAGKFLNKGKYHEPHEVQYAIERATGTKAGRGAFDKTVHHLKRDPVGLEYSDTPALDLAHAAKRHARGENPNDVDNDLYGSVDEARYASYNESAGDYDHITVPLGLGKSLRAPKGRMATDKFEAEQAAAAKARALGESVFAAAGDTGALKRTSAGKHLGTDWKASANEASMIDSGNVRNVPTPKTPDQFAELGNKDFRGTPSGVKDRKRSDRKSEGIANVRAFDIMTRGNFAESWKAVEDIDAEHGVKPNVN